ncbi:MAG: acetoacetate--CoA ligase, partial [Rhizobiales bacterium]|nr:acetoacetate--CoA ligase [Hyphomicrobiales bacterium]
MQSSPLWTPSEERLRNHPMTRFRAAAAERAGRPLPDHDSLHAWSIEDRAAFWDLVWDFCGVSGEKGEHRLVDGDRMPGARFFPQARLNFADNLLRRHGEDDALVFRGEDRVRRRLSWNDLHDLVSRLQQLLLSVGVGEGDRVAAMMPNMPETIAGMLAAASIGAVWSSCSPDCGPRGVLDRFGQIEPKVRIACDGYYYGGKTIDIAGKLAEIVPQIPSLALVVIVPYIGTADAAAAGLPLAKALPAALAPFEARPVETVPMPFGHPLYIMFSSGTTGVPKCIVHSAGGTLLQHLKEIHLHCGIGEGDRLFYFTTCGWMMWNWLASGLATGATLLLYDGSPFHPDGNTLFDYADAERMTLFGTSAKFIDSVHKAGLRPMDTHDLGSLATMTSTGSPLSPESFAFVYEGIKRDIHLASISGGTDIVACFVLGIPDKPVWKGEIQGP